jgi:hypothetical protein
MHGNRRITDRQGLPLDGRPDSARPGAPEYDPFPLLVILGQGGYAKHGAYLQETPQ